MAQVIDIVIRAANQTKKGITEPITDLKSLKSAVNDVGPAFKVASVAAVGALAYMVKGSIDAADGFSKMSAKTGESVEALSTMAHAADLSDVSLQLMQKTLGEINQKSLAVAQGNKTVAAEFESIGIKALDASGNARKGSDIMLELSDKIRSGAITSEQAVQLMGKRSRDVLPMLASDMRGATDEARAMGLEISTGAAQAAEAFNDNLTRLGKSSEGFANQLMASVTPSLVAVTDSMVNASKQGGIMRTVAEGIGGIFKGMVASAFAVASGFEVVGKGLAAMAVAAGQAISGNFAGAADTLRSFRDDAGKTFDGLTEKWSAVFTPPPVGPAVAAVGAVKVANLEAIKEVDAARKKAAAEAAREQEEFADKYAQLIEDLGQATLAIGETEAKNAEDKAARTREIADMERDMRLAGMDGYELDIAMAQAQHADRLRMIDELAAKGATEGELANLRVLNQQALEAEQHDARVAWLNERTDAEGAATRGLVAGYKVFTDKSIAGNKKVEASIKAMWVTFRNQLVEALVYYTAQRIAQAAINVGIAAGESALTAAAWAPAATAATIATVGVAAAQAPATLAAGMSAGIGVVTAMAHGGLENVPKESTYFLDKGERVLSPNQNKDLTSFLSGKGGNSQEVHIYMNDEPIIRGMARASKDGRLVLDARSIKS